jgi:hypothetical protein
MSFRRRLNKTCTIKVPSAGVTTPYNQTKVVYLPQDELTDVPTFAYTETGNIRRNDQHLVTDDRMLFDFMRDVPVNERCQILFEGGLYTIEDVSQVGGGHHLVAKARKVQVI